jgi:hypothetical protein
VSVSEEVNEEAPREARKKVRRISSEDEPPSDKDRKSNWPVILQVSAGVGTLLALVVTINTQFSSMRDKVNNLELQLAGEIKDRQHAEEKAAERLNRTEEALKQWTADEFSEMCRALEGHYVSNEHYCELKDGKILKYIPLIFR